MMGNLIFSLDIGTRTVIGTVGFVKDKKLNIVAEAMVEHEERAMLDGQIHDIGLVAKAVEKVKESLEEKVKEPLTKVAIAAAGRFLRTVEVKVEMEADPEKEIDKEILRGLELTAVKKAEEEINKTTDGKLFCVGYSVKNYYLNSYLISNLLSHKGENIGLEVIATFLPRSVVDSLYAVIKKVGLSVYSLTLEPIAAIEAAVPQKLRLLNLALVDIGAGTSDIAITSDDTVSAFGMVSNAGDEITEALAKNYLIDFNSAELIKRKLQTEEEITIVDILGFETVVSKEEVMKVITPVIKKLADDISQKILELNGNKAPNAVFLVGGGAHTPLLQELVAENLNLPLQRVGIRGREAVEDCIGADLSFGSTGVTVLGIALESLKKSGNDFIDVILNDSVISLFNYRENTVMDVILQAGLNPKVIMARKGKNIRFKLNGATRIGFGGTGKNAVIKINGEIGNIDSKVAEGDKIKIDFAKDGEPAKPKILEYVKDVMSISFYYNEQLYYLEPIATKNQVKAEFEEIIQENDVVDVVYPRTLGDFRKYMLKDTSDMYDFYCGNKLINEYYEINEGDKIYSEIRIIEKPKEIEKSKDGEGNNLSTEEVYKEVAVGLEASDKVINLSDHVENKTVNTVVLGEIEVAVNNEKIILKGKESYVFVDIFNYVNFDLSSAKGMLRLLLNGKKASFGDVLKHGDEISIGWDEL
ncbi:cell division FtsA domain-containing protein [Clostridium cellulovorans]|uniref:Cell division protein FtsA n=1 Tax=Clostridium cellulovorans (strain ATCC 35296 / DSM 3052 / OCM 3 / 743B) TaxID=573061 RepID=D9SX11_CLOC7|nr:cell division FtsA domain-containing protein [Clostridium cellulovorans]ADL51372.1 cell division protein FtsA [Clostridium cellulovorans 743B]